ncbi:hypothetical protein KY359_05155, partial [Candidatus Woesearchaeota archaeon]|nr:hypothetical protein [Candidatus Woesearchaeota archaeon]
MEQGDGAGKKMADQKVIDDMIEWGASHIDDHGGSLPSEADLDSDVNASFTVHEVYDAFGSWEEFTAQSDDFYSSMRSPTMVGPPPEMPVAKEKPIEPVRNEGSGLLSTVIPGATGHASFEEPADDDGELFSTEGAPKPEAQYRIGQTTEHTAPLVVVADLLPPGKEGDEIRRRAEKSGGIVISPPDQPSPETLAKSTMQAFPPKITVGAPAEESAHAAPQETESADQGKQYDPDAHYRSVKRTTPGVCVPRDMLPYAAAAGALPGEGEDSDEDEVTAELPAPDSLEAAVADALETAEHKKVDPKKTQKGLPMRAPVPASDGGEEYFRPEHLQGLVHTPEPARGPAEETTVEAMDDDETTAYEPEVTAHAETIPAATTPTADAISAPSKEDLDELDKTVKKAIADVEAAAGAVRREVTIDLTADAEDAGSPSAGADDASQSIFSGEDSVYSPVPEKPAEATPADEKPKPAFYVPPPPSHPRIVEPIVEDEPAAYEAAAAAAEPITETERVDFPEPVEYAPSTRAAPPGDLKPETRKPAPAEDMHISALEQRLRKDAEEAAQRTGGQQPSATYDHSASATGNAEKEEEPEENIGWLGRLRAGYRARKEKKEDEALAKQREEPEQPGMSRRKKAWIYGGIAAGILAVGVGIGAYLALRDNDSTDTSGQDTTAAVVQDAGADAPDAGLETAVAMAERDAGITGPVAAASQPEAGTGTGADSGADAASSAQEHGPQEPVVAAGSGSTSQPDESAPAGGVDVRTAVYERIVEMANSVPNRSRNPRYNPAGGLSNQNIINFLFYTGTRVDGNPANDYRGGYGEPGQYARADAQARKLLGVGIRDLVLDGRGSLFDGALIDLAQADPSVHPELAAPSSAPTRPVRTGAADPMGGSDNDENPDTERQSDGSGSGQSPTGPSGSSSSGSSLSGSSLASASGADSAPAGHGQVYAASGSVDEQGIVREPAAGRASAGAGPEEPDNRPDLERMGMDELTELYMSHAHNIRQEYTWALFDQAHQAFRADFTARIRELYGFDCSVELAKELYLINHAYLGAERDAQFREVISAYVQERYGETELDESDIEIMGRIADDDREIALSDSDIEVIGDIEDECDIPVTVTEPMTEMDFLVEDVADRYFGPDETCSAASQASQPAVYNNEELPITVEEPVNSEVYSALQDVLAMEEERIRHTPYTASEVPIDVAEPVSRDLYEAMEEVLAMEEERVRHTPYTASEVPIDVAEPVNCE